MLRHRHGGSEMRRVLLLIFTAWLLTGCSALVDASGAGACEESAREGNTEASYRELAQRKPVPGVPEDVLVRNLMSSQQEAMAWDWSTCLSDDGWRCPPNGASPPRVCNTDNAQMENPFLGG